MKAIRLACLFAIAVCVSASPVSLRAQENAPAAQPAVEAQKPPAAAAQPAPAPAVRVSETPANGEAMVSMSFDETPLADVIKAFRSATGANIISAGTNLQGSVSVRLDNVPWKKGLSSILDPQGLQLVEQPPNSGIYVVTAKTIAEIPKITQTFTLQHTRAADVSTLLKSTLGSSSTVTPFPSANVVIVTATEQQVGECEKIITAIDKPRAQVYIEARFVELTAAASKKLGLNWSGLGGDGWGVSFDGATLGYSQNASHSKTRSSGTSGSSSSTKTGSGSSSSKSESSDIFENATRDITESITETVSSTLNSQSTQSSGATASTGATKSHSSSRTFSGSLSADAFKLAINAFEQIDGASVFSNPKVIVANEEAAIVDMTTKEPNVELTFQAATSNNGSDSITTKLALIPGKEEPFVGEAFFSYGISLKVTPRISPSGMITVEIEPSISELVKYFELQGISSEMPSAKFPVIEIRRIKTVFTMNDGKTAVIGGLTRTTESNVDSGIPFLRNLPWVGSRVFGWKSREKEQREIIVFVTVGIADPVDMEQDVGMPKNALYGRQILSGQTKEPGDRTLEDLMNLRDAPQPRLARPPVRPEDTPAEEPAAEADTEAAAAQPAQ
jgi:type II secretory pathway component GspD/PulD (secretin)